jgi:hypothetical protein
MNSSLFIVQRLNISRQLLLQKGQQIDQRVEAPAVGVVADRFDRKALPAR